MTELRDAGLLRLAFADNLSTDHQLALLGRLRERCADEERAFREHNIPMSEALLAEAGWRYPSVVARMGAEYNAWATDFFARLENELRNPHNPLALNISYTLGAADAAFPRSLLRPPLQAHGSKEAPGSRTPPAQGAPEECRRPPFRHASFFAQSATLRPEDRAFCLSS